MILQVYSLRDRKADTFGRPVLFVNLGTLVRDIQALLSQDTMISKYPEDFSVYRLGEFDDSKGRFILLELPDFVLEISTLMPEGHIGRIAPEAGVVSPGPPAVVN